MSLIEAGIAGMALHAMSCLRLNGCALLRMVALCVLVMLACASQGAADETVNETGACFMQSAERYNIPVELLLAVAEVESGLAPYAMNSAGSAILPRTVDDARTILGRLAGQHSTFDVGIMQVNRWWFEKYGEPYEKGLDVCFNIDFGARILAMAIKDHGFTWAAVGSYHSPNSTRKAVYSQKIFARLVRILEKRKAMPVEEYLAMKLKPAAVDYLASRTLPEKGYPE